MKKYFVIGALLGSLLAVLILPLTADAARPQSTPTTKERTCGNPTSNIELTFDDYGDPDRVNAILDVLKSKGVRAGFFPIGSWVPSNSGLIARMRADGHWLGNHTASHQNLLTLSPDAIRSEIAGGFASNIFRPPYGAYDDQVRQIAASMGYPSLCYWTSDSNDWRGVSTDAIQQTVYSQLSPGGVVLMHMHGANTLNALPGLIDGIRARGYSLDPLAVAIPPVVAATSDPAVPATRWVRQNGDVVADTPANNQGSLITAGITDRTAVGIAAPHPANGYWIATADGSVYTFGSAQFFGSMGGKPLYRPVVGIAATPSGNGYWLVASDGGIFSFGDAGFYGSTGAMQLNKPIVGMTSTASGHGYWLVASDGGIFAFGDAVFYGSTGNIVLNQPIASMAATPSGNGYWMVARDGGIFAFGDAVFKGSYPQLPAEARLGNRQFLAMVAEGTGYRLISDQPGQTYLFQ